MSTKVAEEMVRFAGLEGTETVYDIGAGDGRILLTAKRLHPHVRAVGWEYVPTVWLLGKFRIWWSGQEVTFRLGDSRTQDMHDADCIFLYLYSTVMSSLEEKFDRELKPGTKVLSHVFPFPHRQPVAQKEVSWLKGRSKIYLYQW
ncbi:MAG: class I SAM-dependent methyltransferase [Candidatus Peribacteraceae bacterium]|nr:class I SAM-dependent methyltransferase [Candidatus Peribacteraceae bacterium]MDD5742140.1 class I SAM-dependent methyltransferase [Candidatus Peribacteraceae bacterium]